MHAAVFLIAATAVLIGCGYLSVAAVMVFYAYLTRDQAKAGAQLERWHEATALAARTERQVTREMTPAAIEYHQHVHHHYAAPGEPARSPEPARVRTVIPGLTEDVTTSSTRVTTRSGCAANGTGKDNHGRDG